MLCQRAIAVQHHTSLPKDMYYQATKGRGSGITTTRNSFVLLVAVVFWVVVLQFLLAYGVHELVELANLLVCHAAVSGLCRPKEWSRGEVKGVGTG